MIKICKSIFFYLYFYLFLFKFIFIYDFYSRFPQLYFSRNDVLQLGLIETLRETIIYPVAEVRACIAILFEVRKSYKYLTLLLLQKYLLLYCVLKCLFLHSIFYETLSYLTLQNSWNSFEKSKKKLCQRLFDRIGIEYISVRNINLP